MNPQEQEAKIRGASPRRARARTRWRAAGLSPGYPIASATISIGDIAMSFFSMKVTLPRTVELTICARNEWVARRAAIEFVETAFANALAFWADNELIR